jgi:SSS family solute:Na+ symporter
MTMVKNLFPVGMVGLVLAVLTAALVSTIGSALNALSTVFTMDIYVKKFNPKASTREIIRMGHIVTVVGAILSVVICVAIDSIKGLNLFNVFQSVLSFIAPPMAAVFVLGVFWKHTTKRAANFALTLGTLLSIGTGVLYLWAWPEGIAKPHFMMLSFYLWVVLVLAMMLISHFDRSPMEEGTSLFDKVERQKVGGLVAGLWIALIVVMVGLYIFFN